MVGQAERKEANREAKMRKSAGKEIMIAINSNDSNAPDYINFKAALEREGWYNTQPNIYLTYAKSNPRANKKINRLVAIIPAGVKMTVYRLGNKYFGKSRR